MPDGGWEPVDPSQVGTGAGSSPPGGVAGTGGRLARSGRGGRLVVAALVAAVVVGAAVAGLSGEGDRAGEGAGARGDPGRDDLGEIRERTDAERAEAAAVDEAASAAQRAFAQATRRLQLAGSYTYDGTVHAPAASDARPAHAPAPDVTVEGEVLLPLRTHEVAVDAAGRVAETVTIGPTIWQRRAPMVERLATEAYAFAGDVTTWTGAVVPFGAGAARLPGWLAATIDRQHRGDRDGRPTYTATLPANRMGVVDPDRRPRAAEVTLTVDAEGDPLHVTVEIPGDAPTGSAWRLSVTVGAIGEPVTIDIPDDRLPSVTEGPTPAEVRAAGVAAPVELTRLPEGWMLTSIALAGDAQRPGCTRLELEYDDLGTGGGTPDWFSLDVLPPPCARTIDTPLGDPLAAGPFVGGRALFSEGAGGVLSDGRTALEFVTSLPTDDALRLLATLGPYDPASRPTALSPG